MKKNNNHLNHLGIILDGNRRWAVANKAKKLDGHVEGAQALRRTVDACIKHQINYLTVYVFSTENWQRTEEEVNFLMKLAHKSLQDYLTDLHDKNIKINIFGDIDNIKDKKLVAGLKDAIEQTKNNSGLQLNVCFNYGGRAEILRAIKKLLEQEVKPENINEKLFEQYLYSAGMPDPDMIVRTSGEQRLSNFLPWQAVYSELYFMNILWPDFDETALEQVMVEFNKRQRRFGK